VTPSKPAPSTMTFTPETPRASDVEPEMNHVAFLDDIGLALEPELAGLARALFAAPRDVLVVADDLGADEAALEVGVDRTGGLRRRRVALRRPDAHLFRAGRVERLESQQLVRRADHAIQAGFREAQGREVVGTILDGQLRELGLDGRRDHDDLGALLGRDLAYLIHEWIRFGRILGDVRDVHDRLRRDEVQLVPHVGFALAERYAARGLAVLERREQLLQRVAARDGRLLVRLRVALGALIDLLHRLEVREHELRVDDLDVVQRVDLARNVHDVVVLEAAHEVRDRVRLADVREELVAEPL